MALKQIIRQCTYELDGPISPGNKTVFRVRSINDSTKYGALKLLSCSDTGLDNPLEADIPSRISHPNIIRKLDILSISKCPVDCIGLITVMGEGTANNQKLYRDESVILAILYKMANALNFLHHNRIVHLDFKLDNIVMNGYEPQLIDFGSSVILPTKNSILISPGLIVTANFRPPEITTRGGKIGTFTDVWSFGICMLITSSQYHPKLLMDGNVFNEDYTFNYNYIKTKYGSWENFISVLAPSQVIKDALIKILKLDYNLRPTMEQILQFDVFKPLSDSIKIHGKIEYPIPKRLQFPEFIGGLVDLIFIAYKRYASLHTPPMSIFYSIDILMRISQYIGYKTVENWLPLCAACIILGDKHSFYIPDPEVFVLLINDLFNAKISVEEVIHAEEVIISRLNGILYYSPIYEACSTVDDLKLAFKLISQMDDHTLYFDQTENGLVNIIKRASSANSLKLSDIGRDISVFDFIPKSYWK